GFEFLLLGLQLLRPLIELLVGDLQLLGARAGLFEQARNLQLIAAGPKQGPAQTNERLEVVQRAGVKTLRKTKLDGRDHAVLINERRRTKQTRRHLAEGCLHHQHAITQFDEFYGRRLDRLADETFAAANASPEVL